MTGAWHELAADLKRCVAFCTRLPIVSDPIGDSLARATWALPLAGALVGLCGAGAYWLAHALHVPAVPAAALALAATLIVTGCLHEDGLADTADAFGGGATRERKLEIMRDSRIGTYGACALALSLLLRFAALASLPTVASAAAALVAAHAAGRATLPAFMRLVPPARHDGLAASAGRPSAGAALAAALLGTAALLLAFGFGRGIAATAMLALVTALVGRISLRQIGGQTGDVIGALEQVGETAVLICAATAPG